MTLKVEQGVNNLRIRMNRKSLTSNTYLLTFKSKNSKDEYEYTVVDLLNIEVKRCIRSKMHNVSVYNIKVYKSISSTNKKVIS